MTDEPAHSELPPSSADKWFYCHAWRRLTAGLEDTSSPAAEEGTLAHEWLAGHLLGDRELSECPNEEMYDHLMMCAEWILAQPFDEILVEHRVDYGARHGFVDLTGTADAIIIHSKHLTIADLKYGRHTVEVVRQVDGKPAGNLQLMIYLVGAALKFGRRPRYRLVILQPRAWHTDGPIREYWVTDDELQIFEAELEKAIQENFNPRAKPRVGEYCRHWCKALGRCPGAAEHSLSLLAAYPMEDE